MSRLCAHFRLVRQCHSSHRSRGSQLLDPLRLLFSGMLLCGSLTPGVAAWAQTEDSTGIRVVEGDILVASGTSTRSIALSRASQLWTDGIVPYSIDEALSKASTLAVTAAVAHWNEVSGIALVALDAWPIDQALPNDSIRFQPGSGCASWVGRLGGEQEIWVGNKCAAGSVMHEIGHALGLEHEHTRPDRNQYIQINWDNIAADKRHNFNVAPVGSRLPGEYDYESIMHYGPTNFSVNGEATITPLLVSADSIGQRVAPSRGDLAAIARLYETDLSIVTEVFSEGQRSEVNIHVSNELAQGANTIDVDVQVGSGRLLQYIGSDWRCDAVVDGQVSCSLGRLAGSSSSRLILTLDAALLPEHITAVVRSKTPDGDTLNNADGVAGAPELAPANALADPPSPFTTTTTTTYGAAALWLWPGLLLMLFQRQAGLRIQRQAGDRIERFWRWRIAGILRR